MSDDSAQDAGFCLEACEQDGCSKRCMRPSDDIHNFHMCREHDLN